MTIKQADEAAGRFITPKQTLVMMDTLMTFMQLLSTLEEIKIFDEVGVDFQVWKLIPKGTIVHLDKRDSREELRRRLRLTRTAHGQVNEYA